jgi:predicted phosphate transport protein (TIGR00153 family)
MEKANESAAELMTFLESVVNMDWDRATQSRKKIVDLEHDADALKAEARGLVPKSIFLSVPREDVLELVKRADEIPNTIKGISGLMIGRRTLPIKSMNYSNSLLAVMLLKKCKN